jgi:hypothetical protein
VENITAANAVKKKKGTWHLPSAVVSAANIAASLVHLGSQPLSLAQYERRASACDRRERSVRYEVINLEDVESLAAGGKWDSRNRDVSHAQTWAVVTHFEKHARVGSARFDSESNIVEINWCSESHVGACAVENNNCRSISVMIRNSRREPQTDGEKMMRNAMPHLIEQQTELESETTGVFFKLQKPGLPK